MLGEALLDQKKYADAEPLLLSGYEGMKEREATIPSQDKPRLTKALERLVQALRSLGQDEAKRPSGERNWTRRRRRRNLDVPPQSRERGWGRGEKLIENLSSRLTRPVLSPGRIMNRSPLVVFLGAALLFLVETLNIPILSARAAEPQANRPRLIVLTDIGGDPDDQQSMIRLMLYSNEFDIEGLIASAAGIPGELKKDVIRPELIREIVQGYGKVQKSAAARSRLSFGEASYSTASTPETHGAERSASERARIRKAPTGSSVWWTGTIRGRFTSPSGAVQPNWLRRCGASATTADRRK